MISILAEEDGGMMRTIALIAASLAVTACATPEQKLTAYLDSKLDAMVAQPVDVAIARLGEPSGSAPDGPDTIYSWQKTFESTVITTPLYGVTAGSKRTGAINNEGLIQAVVNPDGLITRWHFAGNYAGCHSYAERLVSLAQAETIPTRRSATSGLIVRAQPEEGPRISYPRRHLQP
jgi:hypothetical protein